MPVARPSRRSWLAWIAPAAAATVVAAAGVGILELVQRADRARQAEVLVSEIGSTANRASAIEWQAMAERRLSVQLSAAAQGALARAAGAQDRLERLPEPGPEVAAMGAALARYRDAVRRQLSLLEAGRLDEAAQVDETAVDPAHANLVATLARAQEGYRARAGEITRTTTIGILVLLAAAAAIAALLLWRFASARRAAAVTLSGQRALRASEERFRALVQNSSDVTTIVGAHGEIRYQSPALRGVLGHDPADWVGRPLADLVHPDEVALLAGALAEVAVTGASPVVECRMRHRDGSWRDTETSLADLRGEPEVAGIVLNTRDVTERRTLERQLVHQAFHDSLTGLANRALFGDRVAHALERRPPDGDVATLTIDLDDFKNVNDSLGHPAGDALLVRVAEILRACVRPSDTVARLGGDEFAVLLEGSAPRERDAIGLRILRALEQPIRIGDDEVTAAASIGEATNADARTEEDLLRNADVAMYMAKSAGKARRVVFEPAMREALVARLQLAGDLRRSGMDEELLLVYQPLFDLLSGEILGFEALARWRHPERGLLLPGEFIPLAEQTGTIVPLGRAILTAACRAAREWRTRFPDGPPMPVGVNLSGHQLRDPGLVATVTAVLTETGLDARLLVLEMTESLLIEGTDQAIGTLRQLQALGIRLAIDDFGTGYSSLAYIQRLPADALKIDKSFIDVVDGGGQGESVVATIVDLARTFGLTTVAEGIERPSQADALRRLGCDVGQGHHLSRPLDEAGVLALLAARAAAARASAAVTEGSAVR